MSDRTVETIATAERLSGIDCLVNAPAEPVGRLALAHGAGAAMDSDFMSRMAQLICARGIEVVRFEFPYMARRRDTGKKAPPDRAPVLLNTWAALVEALRQKDRLPLFIGGKSMGGRMASLFAAEAAEQVSGVVCLGYPFHPLGKPDKLRTEHLATMPAPTFIVQGTRDPMGNSDEVASYFLADAVTLLWLDTANHDLKPLRKSGFTHEQYMVQAAEGIVAFMNATSRG